MVDPTITAAAIVTVIAAIGGVTVQIINARSSANERRIASEERKAMFLQAQQASAVAKDTSDKADKIIEKATGIEHLTNSTNSNLQKSLEVMTEKVAGFERLLAQAEQEKRTTASTRAVTDLQASAALHAPAPNSVAPTPATEAPVQKIQTNTADTAANTKRTEAVVADLKAKS